MWKGLTVDMEYGQCASHNLQSSYVYNTIDGFSEYVYSILSSPRTYTSISEWISEAMHRHGVKHHHPIPTSIQGERAKRE